MKIDLSVYSDKIELNDSIWYSKDRKKISYPENGNNKCFSIENDSFWFKHRNACILAVIKNNFNNSVFFDIGGGNGYVTSHLGNFDIQSVLVEPGLNGVLNAKNRGVKNIICSTIEDLYLKNNSIKSIGLFDVVEHIENDVEFLKSLHKVLDFNGQLYITVPTYNLLWSNEDVNAGHFRRYTKKSISKLLNDNGFNVIYSSYFFSLLPIPIFIFRTIPSFFFSILKINKNARIEENDHKSKSRFSNFILEKICDLELKLMSNNRKIFFGSSCIIFAEKIK